jgi:hypothetical protein
MSDAAYVILLLSVALEVCLLWRLSRRQLWRRYIYFLSYVLYQLIVMDFLLFGVWRLAPALYRDFYWNAETLSAALRFLLVWEIFRHTFPRGSTLNRIASNAMALLSLGLGLFSVCVLWGFQAYSHFHSPYPALERGFGLAQALLTLGILFLARYYGVAFGRNLWGIAVGFGAYVSISTVNFAAIDLYHSFLPYWQVLVPLSFTGMLAVWTWAVWTYGPNPTPAVADEREQAVELGWWMERWARTLSTVRKVMHS